MYKKLSELNFKLVCSSLIFILFFLFTLFFFALFIAYTAWSPYINPINYSVVIGMLEYLEVGIFVMAFCLAMYFSHQKYTLEQICFIPTHIVVLCKLGTVILASFLICLIPVTYILIFAIYQGTDIFFTLNTLCYTLVRWIALLLVADTLGFFVGLIIKTSYSYILAAPFAVITSFLNATIIDIFFGANPSLSRTVAQLLSVGDSYVGASEMDYPGLRLDLGFLVESLFSISVSLLLFVLVYFMSSKGVTTRKVACGILSVGAVLVTGFVFANLSPIEYQYTEKIYITSPEVQPYEITKYKGDLVLSEVSRFTGSFTVEPTTSQKHDPLTLRLDECFTIDEISINGTPVMYSRHGDFITVEGPTNQTTYEIKYHGRVYSLSDIGCVNIYTSWLSAALPPNFAFIPIIDSDSTEKYFDICVSSMNTVISNLDVTQEKNYYYLKGSASSICIFTGFLSEYDYNGTIIYRSKYNFVTDYDAVYLEGIGLNEYMNPQTYEIETGSISQPQKAFLIYDLYGVLGFPVIYGDYMLLNYGLTT